jgi:hypothetical protein
MDRPDHPALLVELLVSDSSTTGTICQGPAFTRR